MFPPPTDAEFTKAAEHHRRGDLLEAERACLRTLDAAPRHFGAHYLLGIIHLQRGAFGDAERSIGQALSINPNVASAHRHHGAALAQMRRFEEARASLTKAIALKPDDAEALGQRGNTLHELGRLEEALSDYDRALALKPDFTVYWNNRGHTLLTLNRFDAALKSTEQAIALNANYAAAHKQRGCILIELKRPADALTSFDRAIALDPDDPELFFNRGIVLQDAGRPAEAISSYDEAIALRSGYADAFNNKGNALRDLERVDEALSCYEQALRLSPDFANALYGRGVMLLELGRPKEALQNYERAIALRPDFYEAIASCGMCKLAMGVEETGWSDFEHRWKVKAYPPLNAPTDAPLWFGEDLTGRSILVCAEAGLGDVIQFSRYLPLLAEKGAEVTFLAPERIHGLLKGLPGKIRLIAKAGPNERFDYHCSVMSLPSRLQLYRTKTPVPFPYLAIDAKRSAEWRQRLGEHGFKIGISWQGMRWRGGPAGIVGRWMKLAEFHPLSQIAGVRLISLQKEYGVEQLASLPAGMTVETLGDDFDAGPDAFVDTVAVMQHLDLIVSCDTSIAHVAGALGRPVWIALKHVSEWRWGFEGDTSPWYPTARLFRQKARGDWDAVFSEMASELAKLRAHAPPAT